MCLNLSGEPRVLAAARAVFQCFRALVEFGALFGLQASDRAKSWVQSPPLGRRNSGAFFSAAQQSALWW